ncbi:MAG: RNA 2',3'-cyclic phosphodiesterase [Kiritimatiellales bacterium]|nr:RNA 2',3'-cyclic phosphodiesterase [Kiritimatiellales bacterium]
METIRAFIAVDIGDELRAHLDGLQRRLKKVHADVRWVKPPDMHLTLAFLGALPVEQITPLQVLLDGGLQQIGPFELTAAGTGYYGRRGQPRTIWAGVEDCPPLKALQQRIAELLEAGGIEFDRKPFSPHLTLGRVKGRNHTESLLGKLEKYKAVELGRARITTVELIQSLLKPHGVEYGVLHRVALCTGNA